MKRILFLHKSSLAIYSLCMYYAPYRKLFWMKRKKKHLSVEHMEKHNIFIKSLAIVINVYCTKNISICHKKVYFSYFHLLFCHKKESYLHNFPISKGRRKRALFDDGKRESNKWDITWISSFMCICLCFLSVAFDVWEFITFTMIPFFPSIIKRYRRKMQKFHVH